VDNSVECLVLCGIETCRTTLLMHLLSHCLIRSYHLAATLSSQLKHRHKWCKTKSTLN